MLLTLPGRSADHKEHLGEAFPLRLAPSGGTFGLVGGRLRVATHRTQPSPLFLPLSPAARWRNEPKKWPVGEARRFRRPPRVGRKGPSSISRSTKHVRCHPLASGQGRFALRKFSRLGRQAVVELPAARSSPSRARKAPLPAIHPFASDGPAALHSTIRISPWAARG